MPAPTPIPRGPTVLTLYTADDLLTGPGCPVCRYTGEADDRYRAWFALEAHADAATITGLCSSLGMCPRHTRGLASQPGGASRLTALYRYIMEAARDRLGGGRVTYPDRCPACRHDAAAAERALDTLIEGLAEDSVRVRYRELGGLCIPHLDTASRRRGGRRLVAWLWQTMADTVKADPAAVRWLAGNDQDAETRAALRRATPASAEPGRGMCIACLAAEHSDHSRLAQVLRAGGRGRPDRRSLLCAGHLADLTVLAGERDIAPLLAWQAGCLAASPAVQRWSRLRGAGIPGGCPVCVASEHAAKQAVEGCRTVCDPQAALCVRHLLGLRALDRRAAEVASRGAVERADMLIAELNEAFGKRTWARRHEPRGREMTAWRRAAAFVDGRMFCGCPPR
jgi:hypothetical protein